MKPFALPLLALALLSGCKGVPTPAREAAAAQRQQQVEDQRATLALVPPPSKSRYLAIHSLDAWDNPYITVQSNMLTVHVLQADANPSQYGLGGMLRPANARRQDLTVSLDKLGDALGAIPRSAWPYGRVIAIEEAHKTPKSAELDVRRNMEATMRTLNDLGVVTAEWGDNGPR